MLEVVVAIILAPAALAAIVFTVAIGIGVVKGLVKK